MLPEKKARHNHSFYVSSLCPEDCLAKAEAARDKQWAKWLIKSGDCVLMGEQKVGDDTVNSAPVVMIAPRCFEALKKLSEGK